MTRINTRRLEAVRRLFAWKWPLVPFVGLHQFAEGLRCSKMETYSHDLRHRV